MSSIEVIPVKPRLVGYFNSIDGLITVLCRFDIKDKNFYNVKYLSRLLKIKNK